MEIIGKIWNMNNGEVTAIKVCDDIYIKAKEAEEIEDNDDIEKLEDIEEQEELVEESKSPIQVESESLKTTSRSFETRKGVPILRAVVSDIINGDAVIKAITKHHNISRSSHKKYNRYYTDFMTENYPDVKLVKPSRNKHSKRTKKLGDMYIGFDRTYNVYIRRYEYDILIRAIKKYGFVANGPNLEKETNLPKSRINATLHWMLDENIINRQPDGEYTPNHSKKTDTTVNL